MEKRIEIQKKNRPIVLIIPFFLLIGASAIWVLLRFIYPTLPGFWDLKLSAVGAIIGAVGFGIYSVKKHSSKKTPGLIIDEEGITDHSNIASLGFIPWGDIQVIKEVKGDFNRTLIAVIVKNPQDYIHKSQKMAAGMQFQYQQFGSPILISPASLECDFKELFIDLNHRLEEKQ